MKIYFADGGSTFYDNSRVGYNSCSLTYSLEPFPKGVYAQCYEIDDSFTEQEAKELGHSVTCRVVNNGYSIWEAIKQVQANMLAEKKKEAQAAQEKKA